jgi:cysteinyl-tRNA synthetase
MQLPPIKVFNTLTGQKEDFRPWSPPRVNMYVCGITPYSTSHFGHGMSAVNFDMIRRYLIFRGYDVRYVQNFTDIEDRIIARANELGEDPRRLPERYIEEYLESMRALNVMRATVNPLATGELDKIVELIAGLIEKGHAYVVDGDVYFRVLSDPDYGKLSRRSLDDLIAGARVEVDERKENPADFALWKAAKPGEPTWPSPWSDGRPGWHIECSAMSMRYLGEQIDVHGGGQDLIFPHHENEIAQSESFTGRVPFVRYWLHNGFVLFNETKMSKSLGNVVSLTEALEEHDPIAVRLFILQSHYRSPLNLSDDGFEAAARGVDRLRGALEGDDGGAPAEGQAATATVAQAREAFVAAMDDDFNTPGAIASLFDLAREANRQREAGDAAAAQGARAALRELAGVLGLDLTPRATSGDLAAAPFVELLLRVRRELRAAKQFQLADLVREELTGLGITLEDRPDGTTWRAT